MIASQDRSGYFGASDVNYIIGNRNTKTFKKWWLIKLGLDVSHINNKYTMAGTQYEHKILEKIGCPEMDKQIIIEDLKLRVNLDGNSSDTIYEVKTHLNKFNPKKFYRQVQVQMYATGMRKAYIVAYQMTEKEYDNFFLDIESDRIKFYEIEYDEEFINNVFLPNLKNLRDCLIKGVFPDG